MERGIYILLPGLLQAMSIIMYFKHFVNSRTLVFAVCLPPIECELWVGQNCLVSCWLPALKNTTRLEEQIEKHGVRVATMACSGPRYVGIYISLFTDINHARLLFLKTMYPHSVKIDKMENVD